jgi:hypothetical protein
MNRRYVVTSAWLPLLSSCGLPKLFSLKIIEEVKLHDGPLLLVETTVQFQRQNLFSNYEDAVRRTTTLNFDAGKPIGLVTFTTWLHPIFLDRIAGNWYLVLSGQGPFGKADESPSRWGHSFTTNEQRLTTLRDGAFHPLDWDLAPPSIQRVNLFPLIETSTLAKLNGKRIGLEEKERFLQETLADPYRRQITRPQENSVNTLKGK